MGVKTSVRIDGLMVVAGLVVVTGIYIYSQKEEIKKTVEDAVGTVNPASEKNFINRGVSSLVEFATNGKRKGLAEVVWCWNHPNDWECRK